MLLLLIAIAQLPSPAACTPAAGAPALDHVVLVVADLNHAATGFQQHGFRIKNGRLHANNLLNRHIKFRNGSSIELMTMAGAPGDAMARRYQELLDGSVVIVRARAGVRPRVLGAVLRGEADRVRTIRPHPQFWLRYER